MCYSINSAIMISHTNGNTLPYKAQKIMRPYQCYQIGRLIMISRPYCHMRLDKGPRYDYLDYKISHPTNGWLIMISRPIRPSKRLTESDQEIYMVGRIWPTLSWPIRFIVYVCMLWRGEEQLALFFFTLYGFFLYLYNFLPLISIIHTD